MNAYPRVAVVTGGAQGIGRATAARLTGAGWHVVIADSDGEAGREARAELGDPARFIECDVGSDDHVRGLVEQTAEQGIDLLVNNAGVSANTPPETLAIEDWDRVLRTNLTGAFLCSRHAAAHLRARHGAIVNIASTRALMSEPHTEAYSASKGGIVALTHALAASLAPEVRVNCISPGWIDVSGWQKSTHRQPADLTADDHAQHWTGRVGTPEDIASLVAYLASDEAGFITGANLVVDGGMTRKMIYV